MVEPGSVQTPAERVGGSRPARTWVDVDHVRQSFDPEVRPWRARVSAEEAADPRRPDDPSRLRGIEIDEAVRESRWRLRQRHELWRAVVESALLLALITILVAGFRPAALAMALLVGGPLAGAVIHATRAGRGRCAILGAVAFVVAVVPVTFNLGAVGIVLGGPFALIAFAAYGVRRESRAYVGWE